MKEYSIFAFGAAILSLALDRLLKTNLSRKRMFWLFQGVMIIPQLLVNGYLTGRPIVIYGPDFFFGIRIGTIPIEDFFYGFSLMTFSLVLWEYFSRRADGAD